jgi:hypothetical protein
MEYNAPKSYVRPHEPLFRGSDVDQGLAEIWDSYGGIKITVFSNVTPISLIAGTNISEEPAASIFRIGNLFYLKDGDSKFLWKLILMKLCIYLHYYVTY